MATAENGHALEGVDKTTSRNEPTSRRINPLRWTVGLVVRYVLFAINFLNVIAFELS